MIHRFGLQSALAELSHESRRKSAKQQLKTGNESRTISPERYRGLPGNDARDLIQAPAVAKRRPENALEQGNLHRLLMRVVSLIGEIMKAGIRAIGLRGGEDPSVAGGGVSEDRRTRKAEYAGDGSGVFPDGDKRPGAIAAHVRVDLEWGRFQLPRRRTDRDDLLIPEVWLESSDELTRNVDHVAKPILDTVWQCFNLEGCHFYNEKGAWTLRV